MNRRAESAARAQPPPTPPAPTLALVQIVPFMSLALALGLGGAFAWSFASWQRERQTSVATCALVSVRDSELAATTRVLDVVATAAPMRSAFDTTEVWLADGTCVRPFAFGSTLHHPSTTVPAPSCSAVDALHDLVRSCEAQEAWTNPNGSSSSALLYAPLDALLPVAGVARQATIDDFPIPNASALAVDMLETLGLSMLRDCPVDDVQECAPNVLALLSNVTGRDAEQVLDWDHGRFVHASARPRLSKFWTHTYRVGAVLVTDRTVDVQADDLRLWTRDGARDDAEGRLPYAAPATQTELPASLRSLASLVNAEPVYSNFLPVLYTMLNALPQRLRDEVGGVRTSLYGGYDDVLIAVAEVARVALAEGYRAKYAITQRVRPAAYLRLLDAADATDAPSALRALMEDANATVARRALRAMVRAYVSSRVSEANGLLPMMYPTSRHPSSPHGHATVAAACTTALKALLRTVDTNGTLVPWGSDTTWAAELDKVAFNIALGRNVAGQHVRNEAEASLLFGERIAVTFLQGRACAVRDGRGVSWPRPMVPLYDGSVVTVSCDGTVV